MKEKQEKRQRGDGEISAPVDGKLLPLNLVEDEVFSAGILGDGVAIVPTSGEIVAPFDGVIDSVFDTHHAISMTADFGAEILIHCGIDTVELKGEGFSAAVTRGERVRRGQTLLRFDPALIKERGYYTTTPVLVVNGEHFVIRRAEGETIRRGEVLMRLQAKGEDKT